MARIVEKAESHLSLAADPVRRRALRRGPTECEQAHEQGANRESLHNLIPPAERLLYQITTLALFARGIEICLTPPHGALQSTQWVARFFVRRSSTRVTISSSVLDWSPFWTAIRRTRQSTRSMFAAPPNSARAADEGLPRPSAALAYLSKGTRSSASAP